MGIKLGDNINITAGLPNDCRYQNAAVGPYTSLSEANTIVTADIRYTGLTLNVLGTEYWYKEGVADVDLVEKTSGGGILNWTGSTANAIGTYISSSGICAQPNLTFNGSTLSVTGDITTTICVHSPIMCTTTAFRSTGTGYKYCSGTGCGTAVDWVATSDCRIKKCIEPITSALSKIDALCGVCYELCEDNTKDMGLIAQDVLCVESRLVSKGEPIEEYKKYGIEDELLSLKYDKFAGLFVEAIKELKYKNKLLEDRIKILESERNV